MKTSAQSHHMLQQVSEHASWSSFLYGNIINKNQTLCCYRYQSMQAGLQYSMAILSKQRLKQQMHLQI